MKTKVSKVFVVLAVAAVIGLPAVYAQSPVMLKADVPFDFTIGNQDFSAGECTVQAFSTDVTVIRNLDTRQAKIVLTNAVLAGKTPSEAKLIFHRYGERYFLAQIWTPANVYGRQLPKSKAEREMAASHAKRDTVAVAAVVR